MCGEKRPERLRRLVQLTQAPLLLSNTAHKIDGICKREHISQHLGFVLIPPRCCRMLHDFVELNVLVECS